MQNWTLLNEQDQDIVTSFMHDKLYFAPITSKTGDKPIIQLPQPKESYDTSGYFNDGFDLDLYNELHEKTIELLRAVHRGERIFAITWHLYGYSFDPWLPFEKDNVDEWHVPAFPNGDYEFFFTKDFKNGIFGDGINKTLSFFGNELIDALAKNRPGICSHPVSFP